MLRRFLKPNLSRNVSEKFVVNFRQPEIGLQSLLTRSDEDLGGFSSVHLDLVNQGSHPFARFHGDISLDLPEDRPDIVRLGYAMFRTKDVPPSLLGLFSSEFHDWSDFSQLSMRVRGDYRKYFINIQADTPYPTDLYQHRLFLKTPGEWETVTVSFANFILTNGGVVQQQQNLPIDAIRSVGVGLIDGQFGPYQLDIDWIKVHNGGQATEEGHDSVEGSPDLKALSESSPMGKDPNLEDRQEQKGGKGPGTPGKRLSVDD